MMDAASNQRDLRDPRSYVTDSELKALYQIRPWILARDLAFDWLMIFGSVALWGATLHPLAFLLAFVVIAGRHHSLNNWVHRGVSLLVFAQEGSQRLDMRCGSSCSALNLNRGL